MEIDSAAQNFVEVGTPGELSFKNPAIAQNQAGLKNCMKSKHQNEKLEKDSINLLRQCNASDGTEYWCPTKSFHLR